MTKGQVMTDEKTVLELLQDNQGILTCEEAREAEVDYKVVQRMYHSGKIDKLAHGLYGDPSLLEDPFFIAQYRCPSCIFSHETALYFHGLCDRIPTLLMMTIPSGYNTRLLHDREHYKFFYVASHLHEIGVVEMSTMYGRQVRVYDRERTICDSVKKRNQLDRGLVNEAIRRYVRTPEADFAKLLHVAELFKVRDTVKTYLEILA